MLIIGGRCLLVAVLASSLEAAWGREEELQERPLKTITMAAPRPRPVVGERISFHGRWFGIPVGHGWIEVADLVEIEGRQAYRIEAHGYSNALLSTFYPIHDVLRSFIDAESLQPLQVEKTQREGHYRAEEIVTFDYARGIATYRSRLNNSVKEIPIPPSVHDILSAFYWLRTHPVDPQRSITLEIYSDEKVYHTEVRPLTPITLELRRRGTFPCLMVEPKAAFKGVLVRRGRVWFYITADERRLPLLVKLTTPWGPMAGVIDPESLDGDPPIEEPELTNEAAAR